MIHVKNILKSGEVDITFLNQKKSMLEEEKRKEKINDIMKSPEKLDYALNKDLVIKDLSAAQFYKLYKNGFINGDILNERRNFDKKIIDNAEKYNNKTVAEAITGQYFQKGLYNTCLDLQTIINYNKSKKINDDNSKKIEEIYNYLQGNDEFYDKNYIKKIEEIAKNTNINKIINNEIKQFGDELSNKLNTTQKNIESIKKEYVQNDDIPIYKLKNKNENEKNFTLLVHSTTVSNAREYYKNKGNRISMSLLNDKHFETFKTEIIFGYNKIDEQNILFVSTGDGQTNQKDIDSDGNLNVYANELYSVDEYINKTEDYNEIVLKVNDKKPKPDYLLTYEENPNKNEIEIAQMYNIPIINVDKSKYIDKNLEQEDNKLTYEDKSYKDEIGRSIELKDKVKSIENERIDKNHIKKFANDKNVILEKENAKEMIKKLEIERDIERKNLENGNLNRKDR